MKGVKWHDRVKNGDILKLVKESRMMSDTIWNRKSNWIGYDKVFTLQCNRRNDNGKKISVKGQHQGSCAEVKRMVEDAESNHEKTYPEGEY